METEYQTNDALARKIWHEQLYRESAKSAYFSRFMGKTEESIVQVKTDLEKAPGHNVTFGILMRLLGAGVTGDNTLEGNEESLTTYDFNVTIDQLRHAVISKGKMSEKRVLFSIPDNARTQLKIWMTEQIDQKCFNALDDTPTKIFYGGDATSVTTGSGDIDATDVITPSLISRVKTWASTGGNRSQPPLMPILYEGRKYYIMLVHPDVAYDLKNDTTYAQAQREAQERGKDNPIFTGALGIWDKCVVHEHENIPIVTNWASGSNIAGARCQFMGAQALCWAWGMRPFVKEQEKDYGNKRGFATGMIYGVKKPKFNSKDFGSIGVYVARTKISDV